LSRSQGDIHVDGNPHIHTDPLNGIIIARNILGGLKRVSPDNADYFAGREQDFEKRVLEATMGQVLVSILTPATAYSLLDSDKLLDFLSTQKYQGKPLADRLGGWLKQGQAFRGKEMACYHKEWAYFSHRFFGRGRFRCCSRRTTSTETRSSRSPSGRGREPSSCRRTPTGRRA
ncbi:MAG: hypothetical protein JF602_01865, partial [Gemmatimonadetes bacterium]|nr:hypothetical protein [Gemmatimonadota bacterium]